MPEDLPADAVTLAPVLFGRLPLEWLVECFPPREEDLPSLYAIGMVPSLQNFRLFAFITTIVVAIATSSCYVLVINKGETQMKTYTAIEAKELGTGQSVNGTGKRAKIEGAYTVDPQGRRCRAFTKREGGLAAAQKWADYLNEHMLQKRRG